MLELQHPDAGGDVQLGTRSVIPSAATTRSALEAIKKKFELAAAADVSEKLLAEKGKEQKLAAGGVPSTPDGTETTPAKPPSALGLIDSRGCAKPTKKVSFTSASEKHLISTHIHALDSYRHLIGNSAPARKGEPT